jgi:hypothetical protein
MGLGSFLFSLPSNLRRLGGFSVLFVLVYMFRLFLLLAGCREGWGGLWLSSNDDFGHFYFAIVWYGFSWSKQLIRYPVLPTILC